MTSNNSLILCYSFFLQNDICGAKLRRESSERRTGRRGLNLLDPGHLDHPLELGREDLVSDEPARQLGPLAGVAAVDGEPGLCVLVLGILQVAGYFLETGGGGGSGTGLTQPRGTAGVRGHAGSSPPTDMVRIGLQSDTLPTGFC